MVLGFVFYFQCNAKRLCKQYLDKRIIFSGCGPVVIRFLAEQIRFLVSYCPVSSSFTSSHAANHFAAAMFIFTTFKKSGKFKMGFSVFMGICYFLCTGICGSSFSFRYILRCNSWCDSWIYSGKDL